MVLSKLLFNASHKYFNANLASSGSNHYIFTKQLRQTQAEQTYAMFLQEKHCTIVEAILIVK